mmetsp:Transcript_10470/g.22271  ORF Transcript_10470/g.22271 Transcript_10470/m.22271 type:complete len:138 (+) Transcript_10470:1747-2160(+)
MYALPYLCAEMKRTQIMIVAGYFPKPIETEKVSPSTKLIYGWKKKRRVPVDEFPLPIRKETKAEQNRAEQSKLVYRLKANVSILPYCATTSKRNLLSTFSALTSFGSVSTICNHLNQVRPWCYRYRSVYDYIRVGPW